MENLIREVVAPEDLGMIVSNIGATPDFSAIYTTNSAHAHRLRAGQPEGRPQGRQLRIHGPREAAIAHELPELTAYFQSGGLVDAVLNLGLPAPIDVQVAGSNMRPSLRDRARARRPDRSIPGVADVFIPQDIDYPGAATRYRPHARQRAWA